MCPVLNLLLPCRLRGLAAGGGKADVACYALPAPNGEEELQNEEGHYAFALAELTAAGVYSAVAEYDEQRAELAAGLARKGSLLRSASVRFYVQPGQPVTLRWGG